MSKSTPFRKDGQRGHFSSSSSNKGAAAARRAVRASPNPGPLPQPQLDGDVWDLRFIENNYNPDRSVQLSPEVLSNPRHAVSRFMQTGLGANPSFTTTSGYVGRQQYFRATITVDEELGIIGTGDSTTKKEAERLCCISASLQLQKRGILDTKVRIKARPSAAVVAKEISKVALSDGSDVNFELARQFMDYYCRRFGFGRPDVTYETSGKKRQSWDAIMTVGGRRIGLGSAASKKEANVNCYLDVTVYLESCDAGLWKEFRNAAAQGKDGPPPPNVRLQMSESLADEVRDLCSDIKQGILWRNRPKTAVAPTLATPANGTPLSNYQKPSAEFIASKSARLKRQLDEYRINPKHETMRNTRSALPVYTKIEGLLETIEKNDVTICMAATGSGKTTQVPQLILDQWTDKEVGGKCNVICTQPRRIAAISVAERVAKERGELLGKGSIGYQVRFESKLPLDHGSVTFCTTGIFLKRMQSALQAEASGGRSLDDVTHIVVDEVHERDVDTDLVLVVLKRLIADRKKRGIPLKVVLMSATIDPSLFQQYFPDAAGLPAPVAEIPGRSFPVERRFLDDILKEFRESVGPDAAWVFNDKAVATYLLAEVGLNALDEAGFPQAAMMAKTFREGGTGEDLDMPYPLIALTIAHVIKRSTDGHVLVFLPGWEEIQQVQKLLQDPNRSLLGIPFNHSSKFSVHVLHSAVPIAEQQAVFEPAKDGVRRIILSTNIAETSVTIPDVVYVVDTGKVKEQRYDPDRHISSLISAWVGSSNLSQRAGRAGRHRPGEYYGLVSKSRLTKLNPYQLVEIKRVDLSNVVMHVKALNFPGMEVEDVLAQAIEPPAPERIASAMENLRMVGALDEKKNLTSLGRVLLQLPIEVQMGRLLLFGSFFRCLDHAITLAAILTNRDPFLNPPLMKKEANACKASWSPANFRSDALATLFAYNSWWEIQGRGDYQAANQFCSQNFLSKPSLMQVQKLKGHLLQALYHAGVIAVSAGGVAGNIERDRKMNLTVPPELNTNGDSLPLLAALIAIGSQPNFAIRTSERILRTAQDRTVFIHPASVNNRKHEAKTDESGAFSDKQLFAFAEKVRNVSAPGSSNAQTFIKGNTKLDPMTYLLFGAYNLVVTDRGLECDGWLPIVGPVDVLDDVQRLKALVDGCLLRVFEGIEHRRREQKMYPGSRVPAGLLRTRQEESDEDEGEDDDDSPATKARGRALSEEEIREFDYLTRDVVRVLDRFADERSTSMSRMPSRPATPGTALNSGRNTPLNMWTPSGGMRLTLPSSGYSTPYNYGSAHNSRPVTPSGLTRNTNPW